MSLYIATDNILSNMQCIHYD